MTDVAAGVEIYDTTATEESLITETDSPSTTTDEIDISMTESNIFASSAVPRKKTATTTPIPAGATADKISPSSKLGAAAWATVLVEVQAALALAAFLG